LTGSIQLPETGKWHWYMTVHRSHTRPSQEQHHHDKVTVTINGEVVGQAVNRGGACFGRQGCMNHQGKYAFSTEFEGDHLDYTIEFVSVVTDVDAHMYLGGGELTFLGDSEAALPHDNAITSGLRVINAVDGKQCGKEKKINDMGKHHKSAKLPENPRLTILKGKTRVYHGIMSGGMDALEMSPGSYTCIVTQLGFMTNFVPNCPVGSVEKMTLVSSPILPDIGSARVVLSWITHDVDLDLYMLTQHLDAAQPCERGHRNNGCKDNQVLIDFQDDKNSVHADSLDILAWNPGQYVVRVEEFNGNPHKPGWDHSGALLSYYSWNTGSISLTVADDGYTNANVWYAFAIDGSAEPVQFSNCTTETCLLRDPPTGSFAVPEPTIPAPTTTPVPTPEPTLPPPPPPPPDTTPEPTDVLQGRVVDADSGVALDGVYL